MDGGSTEEKNKIFDKYNLKLTRRSEVPSVSGQPLVGLIEKVGA